MAGVEPTSKGRSLLALVAVACVTCFAAASRAEAQIVVRRTDAPGPGQGQCFWLSSQTGQWEAMAQYKTEQQCVQMDSCYGGGGLSGGGCYKWAASGAAPAGSASAAPPAGVFDQILGPGSSGGDLAGKWNAPGVAVDITTSGEDLILAIGGQKETLSREGANTLIQSFKSEKGARAEIISPDRIDLVDSNGRTTVLARDPATPAPAGARDRWGIVRRLPNGQTLLQQAVADGDRAGVDKLIAAKVDVNVADLQGRTALHEAVSSGDTAMVQTLMRAGANADLADARGMTALVLALQPGSQGGPALVQTLASSGANVRSESVMQAAVATGDPTVVATLVQSGGDPATAAKLAVTGRQIGILEDVLATHPQVVSNSLFSQAMDTDPEAARIVLGWAGSSAFDGDAALRLVLEKNQPGLIADAIKVGGRPDSALVWAIDKKNARLAEELVVKYEADPKAGLVSAVTSGNLAISSMLLDHGADPTPGMLPAVSGGNAELVDLLIQHEAAVDAPELMASAAGKGHDRIVRSLLAEAAPPDPGMAPAAAAGHDKIVAELVAAGAPADAGLVPASAAGHAGIVAELLRAGASPDAGLAPAIQGKHGPVVALLLDGGADATPPGLMSGAAGAGDAASVTALLAHEAPPQPGLEPAVKGRHAEVVSALLVAGADGREPGLIVTAAKNGDEAIVAALLEHGAPAQAALDAGIRARSAGVVRRLLDSGADAADPAYIAAAVDVAAAAVITELAKHGADSNGNMPSGSPLLLHAAAHADGPTVEALIRAGAGPDVADPAGNRPIHVAVTRKSNDKPRIAVVRALIAGGADLNAPNGAGKSPLKIAVSGDDLKNILETAGAKKK